MAKMLALLSVVVALCAAAPTDPKQDTLTPSKPPSADITSILTLAAEITRETGEEYWLEGLDNAIAKVAVQDAVNGVRDDFIAHICSEKAEKSAQRVIQMAQNGTLFAHHPRNATLRRLQREKMAKVLEKHGFVNLVQTPGAPVDARRRPRRQTQPLIPPFLLASLDDASRQTVDAINSTVHSLEGDLVNIIQEMQEAKVPTLGSLRQHASQLTNSFIDLLFNVNPMMSMMGFDKATLQTMIVGPMTMLTDEAVATVSQITQEQLTNAMDVLLERKEGNKVDALQAIGRACLKLHEKAVTDAIEQIGFFAGDYRRNITGLFVSIEENMLSNTKKALHELSDPHNEEAMKHALTTYADVPEAGVMVKAVQTFATHAEATYTNFTIHMNRQLATMTNGIVMETLNQLAETHTNDIVDATEGAVKQTFKDMQAALAAPAKTQNSVQEVVDKLREAVHSRMAKVSPQLIADFKAAEANVRAIIQQAMVSVAVGAARDLVLDLRSSLMAKGVCKAVEQKAILFSH